MSVAGPIRGLKLDVEASQRHALLLKAILPSQSQIFRFRQICVVRDVTPVLQYLRDISLGSPLPTLMEVIEVSHLALRRHEIADSVFASESKELLQLLLKAFPQCFIARIRDCRIKLSPVH